MFIQGLVYFWGENVESTYSSLAKEFLSMPNPSSEDESHVENHQARVSLRGEVLANMRLRACLDARWRQQTHVQGLVWSWFLTAILHGRGLNVRLQ